MSYAGNDVMITDGKEELPKLKKVGVVVQTTQPVELKGLQKLSRRKR